MKKIGWLLITLVILMFSTSCGNEQKQLKIIEQTESTTVCELTFDFKYEGEPNWGNANNTVAFKAFNNKNEELSISQLQYFSCSTHSSSSLHSLPTIFYPGDKIRIFIDNRIGHKEVEGGLVQEVFSKPFKIELWYYNYLLGGFSQIAKTYYLNS